MQILDQAVEALRKRGANGPAVAAKLQAIAALGDEAARVWQGYLSMPGGSGDKYTLISWIGAERARELYELHLKANTLVDEVCAAAGPEARFLVLDESPVVQAYVQLREGQTGPQAAQERLAAQQALSQHVRALADRVRGLKPGSAKAAAKPASKKAAAAGARKVPSKAKAGAKKPVPKKAAKKAVKKPAKKTSKKTTKKAAPKKK